MSFVKETKNHSSRLLLFLLVFCCFGISATLIETFTVLLGSPLSFMQTMDCTHHQFYAFFLYFFVSFPLVHRCPLMPREVSQCVGQIGFSQESDERRVRGRLWPNSTPPLPRLQTHDDMLFSAKLLDNMNTLNACVKFRGEFRYRLSKQEFSTLDPYKNVQDEKQQ